MTELEKRLKAHAEISKNNIASPFSLKREIECMEREKMNRNKNKSWGRKAVALAAVAVICIATVTVTPIANSIKGFFKDITRIDGAIVGTEYANATNEIDIEVLDTVQENGDTVVSLGITFLNMEEAPFPYIQGIAISEYEILGSNNNIIANHSVSLTEVANGNVEDGKALVKLHMNEKLSENEKYFIQIEKMYGLSKGDAPLEIAGFWKVEIKK